MATDAIVPEMSPLGQAALDYAARGIPVFPLKPKEKRPLTENGFYDATTDENQIRRWWRKWPRANIGIPTGTASGWIVLDMDVRHGATIEDLETRFGALPDTLHAQTGSGGWHFVFAHPGGIVGGKKLDGSRYELKADGGYIVAAPSVHPDGPCYAWQNHVEPAPIPGWLSRAIAVQEMERPKRAGAVLTTAGDAGHWLNWALEKTGAGIGDHVGYLLAQQLLVNEVPDVEHVLAQYAMQATVNPKDPFTMKDVARWIRQASQSRIVKSGERARGQSLPLPKAKPERKASALRLVAPAREEDADGGSPPEEIQPATGEHRTDLGNARRLVRRHGHNLRYVAKWSMWLYWDGRRWRQDETGEIVRRAKETVGSIYAEAAGSQDDEERKLLAKWAMASEANSRIEAMIKLAQSEPEVVGTPDAFDANHWLLTCLNGTLDLQTGAMRAHLRSDLITKLAPIAYDPKATCPRWDAFLARIMGDNVQLVDFLQRAIGYTLTGDTSEQVMFLLHGNGQNGKSVLLAALEGMLGDYAMQTPTSTLMQKQQEGIPNDVARLKGARLVKAIETEDGKRLAEALVKQMTGGDMLTARFMRAEWFEFRPHFKIFLAANHKPLIRGTDDGIWRRIRFIPFSVQIPEGDRDNKLTQKLTAEYSGILAWAVRGCLAWQRDGLGVPAEVKEATQGYREEMDSLGTFLGECCEMNKTKTTAVANLYATYERWCEEAGERPLSKRLFGVRLMERGFCQEKGTAGIRRWVGIAIIQIG